MGGVGADHVRAVANWVNLSTPLGMLIAWTGQARLRRGPNRMWIAEQYRGSFPRAGAFTVGCVVIVPGGLLHDLTRRIPPILEHEEAHATQWALLGLSFLPCYGVALAWSLLRTGTSHGANVFEVRADLRKGGYPDEPLRRPGQHRVNGQ